MSYLKYTPFLYLILGAVFIYDGFSKWNDATATPIVSLFIGALAIFMFFFRRRFAKKLEDRNNKP
jgi:predicted membrane-bound mannosyltransferase